MRNVNVIKTTDQFKSGIRRNSRMRVSGKVIDLRASRYNYIVCEDTGEVVRSYKAYLKSKHWRLFRKRYKKSSYYKGRCLICNKTKILHLHHLTYERVGKELLKDVVELCKCCHRNVHKALDRGKKWEQILIQLKDIDNE